MQPKEERPGFTRLKQSSVLWEHKYRSRANLGARRHATRKVSGGVPAATVGSKISTFCPAGSGTGMMNDLTVLGLSARAVNFETRRAFNASPRRLLPNDPFGDTEYRSESVADPLEEIWRMEVFRRQNSWKRAGYNCVPFGRATASWNVSSTSFKRSRCIGREC